MTIMAVLTLFVLATSALAESDRDRIADLERKVEALTREGERTSYGELFLPVGESHHGMGPSASKIYDQTQGVSIGGYGEAIYENRQGGTDSADLLRAIIYLGHRFDEKWLLNTEFEFEHASTDKEGSVSAEFAYLDYLHCDALNFRAGLILIPVGIINEMHEPTTFLSAKRPDVENRIIPTTWRENGFGFFGTWGDSLDYKAFVVNGLKGEDFAPDGLRGGRQKGSKAMAEDLAGVVSLDLAVSPTMDIGGSVYFGDSGQDLGVNVFTTLVEGHLLIQREGLQIRALATLASLDDVTELNRLLATDAATGTLPADGDIESIGEQMFGWYVEAGLDVLSGRDIECSLTPFIRYEEYNTQDKTPAGFRVSGANDVEIMTIGLALQPIEQIIFKADYQIRDNASGSLDDQANLAMGYVF
jgi:hypothetical protein